MVITVLYTEIRPFSLTAVTGFFFFLVSVDKWHCMKKRREEFGDEEKKSVCRLLLVHALL